MQNRLHKAIQDRQFVACISALTEGADANAMYSRNVTLLQHAVTQGDIVLAQLLLAHGANPHVKYYGNDRSLLHVAAVRRNLRLCNLLLSVGVSVHALDMEACTALHDAAEAGCAPIVERLLGAGARGDGVTHSGAIALHKAVDSNDLAVCRLLVEHGSSPGFAPPAGAHVGIEKAEANRVALDYLTPMQRAVFLDRDALVRYFVEECGASPVQVARDGRATVDLARASPRVSAYFRSLQSHGAVVAAIGGEPSSGAVSRPVPSPL